MDGNDFENILKRRGSSKQRKRYLADFGGFFVDGNDFVNNLEKARLIKTGKMVAWPISGGSLWMGMIS